MALAPGNLNFDPSLVSLAENFIDTKINHSDSQVLVSVAKIHEACGNRELSKADWSELVRRYQAVGWAKVNPQYDTRGMGQGDLYFQLTAPK